MGTGIWHGLEVHSECDRPRHDFDSCIALVHLLEFRAKCSYHSFVFGIAFIIRVDLPKSGESQTLSFFGTQMRSSNISLKLTCTKSHVIDNEITETSNLFDDESHGTRHFGPESGHNVADKLHTEGN